MIRDIEEQESVYEAVDYVFDNMSPSELASYLDNNYPKYAGQLVDCIVSELIIAEREHQHQSYIEFEEN